MNTRTQLRECSGNASCARTISPAAWERLRAPMETLHALCGGPTAGADTLAQGWHQLPATLWSRKSICSHCGANCTQIVGATAARCSAAGIARSAMPRLCIEALWRASEVCEKGEAAARHGYAKTRHNNATSESGQLPSAPSQQRPARCETVAHNTSQLTAPVRQST